MRDHHGTDLSAPTVTVDPQPSAWRYTEVTTSETLLALKQAVQNAPCTLSGVLEVVRSDNTSAATHEVKRSRGRELNDNCAALLDHYGLCSTRINRGNNHENGVDQHAHYRLKDVINQAFILRGSRDFHTADDCASFVQEKVEKHNRLVRRKLEQEWACLRSLLLMPCPHYGRNTLSIFPVSSPTDGHEARGCSNFQIPAP
ncbi:MAG: hypothetical protein F4X64_00870 [Chloroflexi bacterium]|nr:hypothetical protein [Chloroflexota bacterium]